MLLLSKFVTFFCANLMYGHVMLYMSLGFVVLLLLWTGNCTGYLRQSHLVLFRWSLLSNAGRSSLRPGKFSSSWFTLRVSERSQPHLSTQKNQVDKVMEEYSNIFSSPTGVPLHCQVKHPIDLTPNTPLPNEPIYRLFVREWGDQVVDPRTAPQGAHPSQLIALWEPNHAGAEERRDLATLHWLSGPK